MSHVVALLSLLVVIGLYQLAAMAFLVGLALVYFVTHRWGVR